MNESMTALAYHIRMTLEDGRVIAPTTAAQRTFARSLFVAARSCRLLAGRTADNHLHLLALCTRPDAGKLAWRMARSCRRRLRLPVAFAPPHFEPVRDQRHLYASFRYVLRQDERHRLSLDPFAEASNLPDLLGMRLLGGATVEHVARWLPRIRGEELTALLGLTPQQLQRGAIPPDRFGHLADAAAAAVALPVLAGRSSPRARSAAVGLAHGHLSHRRIAQLLGMSARHVRRLLEQPADRQLQEAIRRQLRLRTYGRSPRNPNAAGGFPLESPGALTSVRRSAAGPRAVERP